MLRRSAFSCIPNHQPDQEPLVMTVPVCAAFHGSPPALVANVAWIATTWANIMSHHVTSYGGFHRWWIPKMDGL